MQARQIQTEKNYILYDAAWPIHVTADLFVPATWQQRGQWLGAARGRGTTDFVTDGEHEYALRHYRRGGLPGRLIRDSYLWTGLARTRAWREWQLTAELFRRGLPVPRPVACRVIRGGLFYRADLLTVRIAGTRSLAQQLAGSVLPAEYWQAIGRCIRHFHQAGVFHADLNAHNILLADDRVFLIDFDRGHLRQPGHWQQANLARLERSLHKLEKAHDDFFFSGAHWQALLSGYTTA